MIIRKIINNGRTDCTFILTSLSCLWMPKYMYTVQLTTQSQSQSLQSLHIVPNCLSSRIPYKSDGTYTDYHRSLYRLHGDHVAIASRQKIVHPTIAGVSNQTETQIIIVGVLMDRRPILCSLKIAVDF
jgi:hypothetical protein